MTDGVLASGQVSKNFFFSVHKRILIDDQLSLNVSFIQNVPHVDDFCECSFHLDFDLRSQVLRCHALPCSKGKQAKLTSGIGL